MAVIVLSRVCGLSGALALQEVFLACSSDGSIAGADVARFSHEYGRRKPGGANRCHEILRTMFDCAVGGPSARSHREPLHRHRPLPPTAARTAVPGGRPSEARCGPAPARKQMAVPGRSSAADSADRIQARRDTPFALARGQAGPARLD